MIAWAGMKQYLTAPKVDKRDNFDFTECTCTQRLI